jgi:hypothetical protein
VAIGFPLLADNRIWHTATNSLNGSGKFIPSINRVASSQFLLLADWINTISYRAGTPLKWISHIFWLTLLEPVFNNSKSKFPFNKKIKYQQFDANGKPFN